MGASLARRNGNNGGGNARKRPARNDRNATDFDAIAVVSSATQSKLRAFNVRGLKPSTRLGKGLVGGIKG